MDREALLGLLKDWGIALAIGVGAVLAWQAFLPTPVREGDAPPLALPDPVTGALRSLDDFDEPVVVVNFWATWCAPCRDEIPALAAFDRAREDVVVLGVSVDDLPPQALVAAAERLGVDYPILHDRSSFAAGQWGVSAFPTTFVLDATRDVVTYRVGPVDEDRLGRLVERALAEP